MSPVRFVRRFARLVVVRREGQSARRNRGERETNPRTGEPRRDENGGGVENEERIEWERMLTGLHGEREKKKRKRKKLKEAETQEDETGRLERRVPSSYVRRQLEDDAAGTGRPRGLPWRVPRTTVGVAALRRGTSLARVSSGVSLRLFVRSDPSRSSRNVLRATGKKRLPPAAVGRRDAIVSERVSAGTTSRRRRHAASLCARPRLGTSHVNVVCGFSPPHTRMHVVFRCTGGI